MTINWNRRKYTEIQFVDAWNSSITFAEVISKLPLNGKSGTQHKLIKQTAMELNLSFDHFVGQRWATGLSNPTGRAHDIQDILTNKIPYTNSHNLKVKLWKLGIKQQQCEICGITEWCGEPAPLCLDHKDGIRSNNLLDNLRILCHNCHAQTETFSGKNTKRV